MQTGGTNAHATANSELTVTSSNLLKPAFEAHSQRVKIAMWLCLLLVLLLLQQLLLLHSHWCCNAACAIQVVLLMPGGSIADVTAPAQVHVVTYCSYP